jgi:hypothetical protein
MGMRETLLGRARFGGIIRGIALAAIFVAVNGFAAFNWVPSSYQQFTWEAYAGVVYTATSTATATATTTSTATATSTPTVTETPVPNGGSCMVPSECGSGFCVDGICCNTSCTQPGATCEDGTCSAVPAAAPVVSHRTLLLIVALLAAIGFFALTPLRFGKRR